jgi:hypothetical protein
MIVPSINGNMVATILPSSTLRQQRQQPLQPLFLSINDFFFLKNELLKNVHEYFFVSLLNNYCVCWTDNIVGHSRTIESLLGSWPKPMDFKTKKRRQTLRRLGSPAVKNLARDSCVGGIGSISWVLVKDLDLLAWSGPNTMGPRSAKNKVGAIGEVG